MILRIEREVLIERIRAIKHKACSALQEKTIIQMTDWTNSREKEIGRKCIVTHTPVEAPLGTAARNMPLPVYRSTSTVGLPRLSSICRAWTFTIVELVDFFMWLDCKFSHTKGGNQDTTLRDQLTNQQILRARAFKFHSHSLTFRQLSHQKRGPCYLNWSVIFKVKPPRKKLFYVFEISTNCLSLMFAFDDFSSMHHIVWVWCLSLMTSVLCTIHFFYCWKWYKVQSSLQT